MPGRRLPQQTVRVTDMGTEPHWPLFAARAADLGAGSMLALQLYVEGDNLGALNLYAATPAAFTDDSEQIGLLVAAHAAIAYIGARKEKHAAEALSHRDPADGCDIGAAISRLERVQ